ncbi:MAG: hypothetical protein AABX02_00120 [archaeon]
MNRSGFFSSFLMGFAIVLLIAVVYTSSVRTQTQSSVDETLIAQQELSKEWFLARNVFSNFASDAIMSKISTNPPVSPSCAVSFPDYADVVQPYWNAASNYMKTNLGVNCQATLNVGLQNDFETLSLINPTVEDEQPAYAILTCAKSIGDTNLSLQHPFVIKKDIRSASASPSGCQVDVFDVLGVDSPSILTDSTLEVSQVFP